MSLLFRRCGGVDSVCCVGFFGVVLIVVGMHSVSSLVASVCEWHVVVY